MEPRTFDALSRAFAEGTPRRVVLKTLAASCLYGAFRPILRARTAYAAMDCAAIEACVRAADDLFEREAADCQEAPNPGPCIAAARRRHDAAVKACGPCPTGTRCESNTCCPDDKVSCATQPAPGCLLRNTANGDSISHTVQGTVNGQPLAVAWISDVRSDQLIRKSDTEVGGTRTSHSSTTVFRAGQPLFAIQVDDVADLAAPARRAWHSQFRYDPSFGVRSVHVAVENGQVSGDVDGRPFQSFPIDAPIRSLADLRFVDGRPAPTITIDAALASGIKSLGEQAKREAATCKPGRSQPGSARPGTTPFSISTGQRQLCNECMDTCRDDLLICQVVDAAAVGATCIFCPPCCVIEVIEAGAAASGGCDVTYGGCLVASCLRGGKACCPVFCHFDLNPGEGCCDSGEVCVDEHEPNSRSGCCSSDKACGSHCCGSNERCQPGDVCCPQGALICNGVCCTNGTCDSRGDCCPSPSRVCAGTCCAPFDVCCNNACCGGDNLCINNQVCCPRDLVCGQTCCPAGQHCLNGACAPCSQGTVPCSSPGRDGVIISTCCPPGANCCLGVCCTNATGHECTGPNGACGTLH